ncbi:SPOR domain-containing protein [Halomonas marinisediminis]
MSEREQAGRTVYRVRLGPYDNQSEAESQKERLAAAGVDATLVRVQK